MDITGGGRIQIGYNQRVLGQSCLTEEQNNLNVNFITWKITVVKTKYETNEN